MQHCSYCPHKTQQATSRLSAWNVLANFLCARYRFLSPFLASSKLKIKKRLQTSIKIQTKVKSSQIIPDCGAIFTFIKHQINVSR